MLYALMKAHGPCHHYQPNPTNWPYDPNPTPPEPTIPAQFHKEGTEGLHAQASLSRQ